MVVINNTDLLHVAPIKNMLTKKHREHGVSYGLSEAGYDIRVKQEIVFGKEMLGDEDYVISNNTIYADHFCLASAIEEFQMPNNMVGVVHDKSTWARQRLSVLNTVIEPGWKGFLTLELVFHGKGTLVIPAGSGIAQILFHQTSHWAEYEGKYQNQEDRPVSSIWDK